MIKKTKLLVIFFISFIFLSSVTFVNAQGTSERELEIGVYDDYLEIMSYNYVEGSQSAHATELEIRVETQGNEGPISIELEYYSESETSSNSSEAGLYFRLTFNRIIEYYDDNSDGVYNYGSDTVVKSELLGDRGIVMYTSPSVKQISINGKEGYQISINSTIPIGGSDFDLNIKGYIFGDPVTMDGLSINPTEFKFDIIIQDFPFDNLDNGLALETILTTEFEVESSENGNESYKWIESSSAKGYFGWVNHAIVDGTSKPVTDNSQNVGGEDFVYLCYEAGALIIHDPTFAVYMPSGLPLYVFLIVIIGGLLLVGILVAIFKYRRKSIKLIN